MSSPGAGRRGIQAIVSDFGGVLTSPLMGSFAAFQQSSGISLQELGEAMFTVGQTLGENPLHELERGHLSEAEFLRLLGRALTTQLGREVTLDGFGARYFEHLRPNEQLIGYMRKLRERGLKLAICTNNVREWEPLWRAKLPVDEIFDVVVDSAFIGVRKPDPGIYEVTLERLGTAPGAALLIDDLEINCEGARALGMEAVWFRETEQAIAEVERALADGR